MKKSRKLRSKKKQQLRNRKLRIRKSRGTRERLNRNAILDDDENYVKNLTTINLNVNEPQSSCFMIPLFEATQAGNYKRFKQLIKLGADIHQRIPADQEPLLYKAILSRNCDIIRYLIENGTDVNARWDLPDDDVTTALHLAVETMNKEVIKLLVDHNADLKAKSKSGATPLASAAIWFDSSLDDDVFDDLSTYPPDLFCSYTYPPDFGSHPWCDKTVTIFHAAIDESNWKLLYDWLFKFADTIDANNNNIDLFTFFKSQLILHHALSLKDCDRRVINYLLDVGVDVNALDSDNKLPIESKNGLEHQPNNIESIEVYIVELIAAGFYVCDRNIKAVSTEKSDRYSAKCRSEVEKMKKNKIEGTNITFFEVLHKNIHYSAQYLKFVDFLSILEREPCEFIFPEYPIYDNMLFYKLLRVFKRVRYIKDSEEIIYDIFYELQLPDTFVRNLYFYLSNYDLDKIIQLSHEEKKARYLMNFSRRI